jgi:iron complex outermembrane receptor protein
MDRLDQLTPALSTQNGGTGPILFIRGVGNFAVAVNADPAVAVSYDGIYLARPTSMTGMFFDLDRIEVLKGPQGTLYGRNATGGAINLIPVQPRLHVLEGYGTASYGNYNALTLEGAVNLPLGDEGALRVSGSLVQHDGYLRDGTLDQRDWSFRTQLRVALTPRLTVRASVDYSHAGGVGFGSTYLGNYVFNAGTRTYGLVPSGLPLSEGFFTPAAQAYHSTVRVAGRNLNALAPYPFQDNSYYGSNAEISYETDVGTLTIIPGWRYASLDFLTGVVDYRDREKDQQYSAEARFTGRRLGIFDYTIGGYYFDESIHQRLALSLSSALALTNANYLTQSSAIFGRLTAHLTDQLRLVGGIRYSHDSKSFNAQSISGVLICPSPVGCPNGVLFPLVDSTSALPFNFPTTNGGVVPQFSGGVPTGLLIARSDGTSNSHLANSKVTYRAAVEYDLTGRSLLYASYETGYRSGGFNSAAGFETYQPETIGAFTLGMRNRLLGGRLQLNLEGFYWNYRNQQVSHVGLDLNGRTANYTQNIGRSRIWGGEAEVRALVTPTTLLSADVQYLNTRDLFFDFQQAIPTPASPPPLSGCAVTGTTNPVLFNVSCTGRPAYNSPKWTLNLAVQQTIPVGSFNLVLGADTQFKSRRVIGFEYLPSEIIGGTWQSNAQIAFGPASDRWTIALFVQNIENDRVVTGTAIHPTANILTAQVTEPRLYGVRGSIKF